MTWFWVFLYWLGGAGCLVVAKQLAMKVGGEWMFVYANVLPFVAVLGVVSYRSSDVAAKHWVLGVAMALLGAGSTVGYVKAVSVVPGFVLATVAMSEAAVATGIFWMLGEQVSLRQWTGVAFGFASMVLIYSK